MNLAYSVPAVPFYQMLSGIGDTLNAGNDQANAQAQQQYKNALEAQNTALVTAAATGQPLPAVSPIAPPVPQSFIQRLIGGFSGGQGTPAPVPAAPAPIASATNSPAMQGVLPVAPAARGPGSPTPAQAAAYGTYRAGGLPPTGAQAIVAGLSGESGANLDPNSQNNSGTEAGGIINPKGSFGVANWNGPRQAQLVNYARQTGGNPASAETQHAFVQWDLQHNFPQVWQQLNDPDLPAQDKLAAFVNVYENPKDKAGAIAARTPYLANNYGEPAGAVATRAAPNLVAGPGGGSVVSPDAGVMGAAGDVGAPGAPGAVTPAIPTGNGPIMDRLKAMPIENLALIAGAQSSPGSMGSYLAPIAKTIMEQRLKEAGATPATVIGPDDPRRAALGIPDSDKRIFQQTGAERKLEPLSEPKTDKETAIHIQDLGEDKYGNKIKGYMKADGTPVVVKLPTPEGGEGTAAEVPPDVHGQPALDALDPALKGRVQMIVEGRGNFPTGRELTTPFGRHIAEAVSQVDPSFETGNPQSRIKVLNDFKSGRTANAVTAGNTALLHLGELNDLANKIDNFDTGIPGNEYLNKANNAVAKSAQNARSALLKSYDSINQKYAGEIEKFYAGVGTQSEREADIRNMDSNMSPTEMRAVMAANAKALGAKVAQLQDRWRTGMGPLGGDFPLLGTQQQAIMRGLGVEPPTSSAAEPLISPGGGQQGGQRAAPVEQPTAAAPVDRSQIPPAQLVDSAKKAFANPDLSPGKRAAILDDLRSRKIDPSLYGLQ